LLWDLHENAARAGAGEAASIINAGGGTADAVCVDVAGSLQVRSLINGTAAKQGRIDYLFNNAGIGIPFTRLVKSLLWTWNAIFIAMGVASFPFPSVSAIIICLTVEQTATISGSLMLMGMGMRNLRNPWWKSAFVSFFAVSFVFLLLLILDILISSLPIRALEPVDNLSLPIYLIVLNAGIYYFSGKFLSREALVKKGKLTSSCLEFYQLTLREAQIIEELILGRTNKQIEA
jgi:NAD(P)-dependent dehydrogenase (short-subunit alcohol dehydrogenase family)